jgi:hypothetical protein
MARGRHASEDVSMLEMALVGFNIEKQRIEARIQEIHALLRGRRSATTGAGMESAAPRKRELSADARRRIAMAQKRRWAEHRKRAAQAKAQAKPQVAKAGAGGAQ